MGRTTSSSKPKSSIKKKSKLSSQTRRKKTSKRKKSKRVYSDDTVSSYSDESLRPLSVSLSDSEDGNVSRKGRSRVRDKVKSSKKRVRRSCSSDDSSVDVKVRKRSKRSGESKVRKNTHKKKKKSRRKVSVSSSSSDSGIERTRRHDSPSDMEESEHERKRGRSKKRKKDKTSSDRTRDKKRKLRSRSCSSCSRYSDDTDDLIKDKVVSEIDQNRDIVTSEIFPRRLKSVITVVQPHYEEEVTGQDKDESKEEIFYDQDDYPSCRSNDSNDGVRRDLARKSYIESEEERAEYMVGEEDLVSELVVKESKLSSADRIDQSDRASLKGTGYKIEIDTSTTTAGSGSEDLETILRQKALENLMRFRGPHRNAKPPSHHENKSERNVKSLTAKADDVQNRSSKQELSSGVGETGGTNQHSRRTMRTNSSRFVQTEEMKLDGRDIEIESSTANQRVVHPSDGVDISVKSESNTSPLMEQPQESSLEQVPPSPLSGHVQGTSPTPKNVIQKSAAEKAETVAGSIGDNQNVGVIDACVAPESSSIKPISEEHNSKPQDESKGNSFEQKTMSVMRGGEMVQVSYKVYIPNKAPALARRKLQR
ncbi:putative dentin sialophosphoprotein [Heracleum sosnowskyi]|uniref:Dentin sialophosphoprotein n=1 Tax=Heracleum sosnowskyi TaxID=360622 RepID=A0AAD8MZ53_9APIA|nr:putative dentin sialophosphoprotein [Heracleum sosnowskyi]